MIQHKPLLSSSSLLRTIVVVLVLLCANYFFRQKSATPPTPSSTQSSEQPQQQPQPNATNPNNNSPDQPTPPSGSGGSNNNGKPNSSGGGGKPNSQSLPQTPSRPKPPATEEGSELNRQLSTQRLYYTKHARCRMECRHISETDVIDILQHGTQNTRKSDPNNPDCPKYALEGKARDGQRIRLIAADCGNETRLITVIDLDKDHYCQCD